MDDMIDGVRRAVAVALATNGQVPDCEPIYDQHYDASTAIRGHLLYAWALKAGDPGAPVLEWLWNGGTHGHIESLRLGCPRRAVAFAR